MTAVRARQLWISPRNSRLLAPKWAETIGAGDRLNPVRDGVPGLYIRLVPTRDRPTDACPGALQVHLAADGGVARIRLPGGRLTASQLRAVLDAASRLGDGTVELTSRANLQIRGLAPGAESALAGRLAETGLLPSATHERVRNIIASPLTGRDGAGVADVGDVVQALDKELCAR